MLGIIPVICAKYPHIQFLVGGGGPRMIDLEVMVDRHNLQERVELVGSVPQANVRDVRMSRSE